MDHPKIDTQETSVNAQPPLAQGLYIVATPIGNLGDLTARAADILRRADLVLVEDRRITGRLLRHIGAKPVLETYTDHNAAKMRPRILARLAAGASVALVSDAGTPLISDPGYRLVDAARAEALTVHAVPGPSAVIAALSVAGLPTDRFLFLGFAPTRTAARRRMIAEVAGVRATLAFHESPRRLRALLDDLLSELGERPAAVARELTKLHEEVRRGPLSELARHYAAEGDPKGEIVVLVGRPDEAPEAAPAEVDAMLRPRLAHMSTGDAAAEVAAVVGWRRRDVYRRALRLKDDDGAA